MTTLRAQRVRARFRDDVDSSVDGLMGCAGRRTDPRNLPRCRSNRRGASFGQGGVNGNDSEARPWEKADKMREVWSADAPGRLHDEGSWEDGLPVQVPTVRAYTDAVVQLNSAPSTSLLDPNDLILEVSPRDPDQPHVHEVGGRRAARGHSTEERRVSL